MTTDGMAHEAEGISYLALYRTHLWMLFYSCLITPHSLLGSQHHYSQFPQAGPKARRGEAAPLGRGLRAPSTQGEANGRLVILPEWIDRRMDGRQDLSKPPCAAWSLRSQGPSRRL